MTYDSEMGDVFRTMWYADPKELNKEYEAGTRVQDLPTTKLEAKEWGAADANLVSSLTIMGDEHLPVLDIDFEARLIPSSRPGHYHLYLDGCEPLSWDAYLEVLEVLAKHGIIGAGWLHHSKQRRMTVVRRPHVKKPAYDPIDPDEPF